MGKIGNAEIGYVGLITANHKLIKGSLSDEDVYTDQNTLSLIKYHCAEKYLAQY